MKDFEMRNTRGTLIFCLLALIPIVGTAQQGELFTEPFVVEHYLVQEDENGERYQAPSVTDTYGGSWIVSERVDQSRLVVDLARGELTEIRPEDGTFWTVGFERLNRLMERVQELEGTRSEDPEPEAVREAKRGRTAADWVVEETRVRAADGAELPVKAASLLGAEGVRHVMVRQSAGAAAKIAAATKKAGGGSPAREEQVVEIWADPKVRLQAAARSAMARFERDALGAEGAMDAARKHLDGAFPIRTVRAQAKADGTFGKVENVVLRLEKIDAFDRDLVRIPEGLRRVPHPLEGLVSFLEREDRRQKMMSGETQTGSDGYGGGEG